MMLSELLVVALMLNTAFFLWQIQKLTNKIMSRNFGEYVTSNKYEAPKQKTAAEIQEEFADDLAELNRLG